MQKVFIAVLLLLATTIALSITFPTNGYDTDGTPNDGSYTVTWTGTSGNCFDVQEKNDTFQIYTVSYRDTGTSRSIQNKPENKYYYKVRETNVVTCDSGWSSFSDEKSITVDKTLPAVSSSNPISSGSGATIDFTYSEHMDTASGKKPSVSGFSGSSSSGWVTLSDTIYHWGATGLTKGQSYTITINGGYDLAGNQQTNAYSINLLVDPDLTGVTLTSPISGSTVDQGSTITITASTQGSSGAIISDAVVSASGACSATLSHTSNGVYSGTCTVNTVGSNTLTVTATRGSASYTATATFSVQKAYGINVTVLSPTATQYKRGENVNFSIKLIQPEQQAISGPSLDIRTGTTSGVEVLNSFDSVSNTFTARYTIGLSDPNPLVFTITAGGTIAGKQVSSTKTLSISLASAAINANTQLSPVKELYNPGEIIKLKTDPKYADGTRLNNPTISGTLQGQTVIFQKQPDGSYLSNQTYIILATDSAVAAHVVISDSFGNSKTDDVDFEVAGGLFTITIEKPQIREISKQQNIIIQLKVLKEGLAATGASVSLMDGASLKTFDAQGNGVFTTSYSNIHTEDFSLRVKVSQNGQETSKLLNFAINNNLLVEAPQEISGQLTVAIRYPNGDPVTEGTFTADIDGAKTTLESKNNGTFVGSLGAGDGTHTLSLSGTDNNQNTLSFSAPITVKQSTEQLAIYGIGAVLLIALAGGGYVMYHQASAGLRKDYYSLLEQMTGVRETMMKAEQDFYKRRISEDQFRKLGLDYQQEVDNYRRKVVDLESKNSRIKAAKYDFALTKAKELASQGMSEGQISKILKDFDDSTVQKALQNYKKQAVQQSKVEDAQLIQAIKGQIKSGVTEDKIRDWLADRFPAETVERILQEAKKQ